MQYSGSKGLIYVGHNEMYENINRSSQQIHHTWTVMSTSNILHTAGSFKICFSSSISHYRESFSIPVTSYMYVLGAIFLRFCIA